MKKFNSNITNCNDTFYINTESPDEYPSTSSTPIGRRGSYKTSRGW